MTNLEMIELLQTIVSELEKKWKKGSGLWDALSETENNALEANEKLLAELEKKEGITNE